LFLFIYNVILIVAPSSARKAFLSESWDLALMSVSSACAGNWTGLSIAPLVYVSEFTTICSGLILKR
jgi:hypothetical protein